MVPIRRPMTSEGELSPVRAHATTKKADMENTIQKPSISDTQRAIRRSMGQNRALELTQESGIDKTQDIPTSKIKSSSKSTIVPRKDVGKKPFFPASDAVVSWSANVLAPSIPQRRKKQIPASLSDAESRRLIDEFHASKRSTVTAWTLAQGSGDENRVRAAQETYARGDFVECCKLLNLAMNEGAVSELTLNLRGDCYRALGQYADAVGDYSDALALQPMDSSTYLSRALCYLELNECDLAESECAKVMSLQEPDAFLLTSMARVLARKGDHDAALDVFSEALEYDPTYPDARFYRGALWLELGKEMEARTDLASIKAGAPFFVRDQIPVLERCLKQSVGEGKEFGRALLMADPSNAAVALRLARCLEEEAEILGVLRSADDFESVSAKEECEILKLRGICYAHTDDFNAAIEDLSGYLTTQATDWKTRKIRAECYERLGGEPNLQKASHDYRSVLNGSKDDSDAHFFLASRSAAQGGECVNHFLSAYVNGRKDDVVAFTGVIVEGVLRTSVDAYQQQLVQRNERLAEAEPPKKGKGPAMPAEPPILPSLLLIAALALREKVPEGSDTESALTEMLELQKTMCDEWNAAQPPPGKK